MKWYEDYNNVLLTARHLADTDPAFHCSDALLYFLEKPWKFEQEYQEAKDAYEAGELQDAHDMGKCGGVNECVHCQAELHRAELLEGF